MKIKLFSVLHAVLVIGIVSRTVVAQTAPTVPPGTTLPGSGGATSGARVRELLQGSGMTQDQIRSRLRAEGYSESLLDPYLAGSRDSTAVPGESVVSAIRLLGLADSTTVDALRGSVRGRQLVDSAFLDTIAKASMDDSTRAAIRRIIRSREGQRAQIDSGFVIFGLDLFSRETSQFDPNLSGAVDPNYRIGPGDRLALFLSGDVEKSYPLEVTRDGFIVVPEVGTVNVANLTMTQAEDVLFRQLSRVYSRLGRGPGATTRFSLSVGRVGVNQVFVTGDVTVPSTYRVSRAAGALTALYMAGGPTSTGSLRNIQVHRGDQTVGTIDFYDYALHGDASKDVRLESGDIIFVPPRGSEVRVAGAVLRPATYELKPTETLADVLRMAGGFRADADRRRVQIERIIPPTERTSPGTARRTIEVASQLLASGYGPPEPMSPGDIVHVFLLPRRVTSRVTVEGNVWTPGPVALAPAMRLSDALRRAGGLKPDSYLGQVLVSRLRPDSSRAMFRTGLTDTTGSAVDDIPLADADEIHVFSLTDFRPQTYVTISGAVKKPGRVAYRDGMTLRDLVLLAGGLDESALLTEAEIARLPESRARGVTAVTERVRLDSTYVLGRTGLTNYPGVPGVPAAATGAPDVTLHPYDAVLILRQTNWELQRIVTVAGEVRYPGPYTLRNSKERLSDIIARAGGLTERAYAEGTTFTRQKGNVGRVGLDLPAVLRNPNDIDNLELTDGDVITVPTYAPIVQVAGAVNSPVAVAYLPGRDINYYIRAAGGRNSKGDTRRAYVTQASGKVESSQTHAWLFHSHPTPGAGSTVTVPERDPSTGIDVSSILAGAASILGSLVAIVAIVKR